ncbi:MAG: hypothetical protein JJU06_21220 [Ectothiorhodospiraceae bacterium]|nr:hypothetical protein [Ectothiorhodospiraceae bacterium]MCH8505026.1 hypothetical protein [Ectothiorhodospiraceae bacterium]
MKRPFTRLLVILVLASAPPAHASDDFPETAVCTEMERAGEDLLEGDPHGFYFVEALNGTFPIPRFFRVARADYSAHGDIVMKAWTMPALELQEHDLDQRSNACHWHMTIHAGPRENVRKFLGGEPGERDDLIRNFAPGNVEVYVLGSTEDEARARTVIALNEAGYIAFTTMDEAPALWMLQLYEELSAEP